MSTEEQDSTFLSTQRYAVVTGANKGMGLEICKELASKGIIVVLTSRDENMGKKVMEDLKEQAYSHHENIVFHQLDVLDPSSIFALVEYVKTQYGKLDILVNNAGILGVIVDENALEDPANYWEFGYINWRKVSKGTYELGEICIQTNYYGAKKMIEAFLPLLSLSNSSRIVNVSATAGKLKYIVNEWATKILSDAENLNEEQIDEILDVFLKDFKKGSLETNNWPPYLSSYTLSKAAVNAYTKILAKKYPSFMVNSICPGYVKTGMTYLTGHLSIEEGAHNVVRLALQPKDGQGHSGRFLTSF